jgi:glucose-6-phosphate 1-dehydrogenase
MTKTKVAPHLFVILGGTGDLAQRKLFPALYKLLAEKKIKDIPHILGVGTRDISDNAFRDTTRKALDNAGISSDDTKAWCSKRLHYRSVDSGLGGYDNLEKAIRNLEKEHGLAGNRVYYLALPPDIVSKAVEELGQRNLHSSSGWVRLVIEKPFGKDLESARELNQKIHNYFRESQVFRIDHYLGKETVQNLLIFRFANTMFEALWNRKHIAQVQITVAESIGIEGRARFYEQAGAVKDIVQNHIIQLVTLTAMEVPALFEPQFIRNEKVKVLHSMAEINPSNVVFGQYQKGRIEDNKVKGYREEKEVNTESRTETFAAVKLEINNWRWKGVPFYIRTGKRLPRRLTQIVVEYQQPPVCMFQPFQYCQIHPNRLLITLQPNEGFDLSFDVKKPADTIQLQTEKLNFLYKDAFGPLPEAYETLLFDIMRGDQTLFVRNDEAELSWKRLQPLLTENIPIYPYDAGEWGPSEADTLFTPSSAHAWINPEKPS